MFAHLLLHVKLMWVFSSSLPTLFEYLTEKCWFVCSPALPYFFFFYTLHSPVISQSWWLNWHQQKVGSWNVLRVKTFSHFHQKRKHKSFRLLTFCPLSLCAVSRCAEPAGEFEPAPGPAALREGRGVSGIHPGRAPHAGTVAARNPGGQHRRTEWVHFWQQFTIHTSWRETKPTQML